MGKARGGGSGQASGQGLSPALAGGRKGKGKARIDLKALGTAAITDCKKTGKQKKPPSGGAGVEASGRGRLGPPRAA